MLGRHSLSWMKSIRCESYHIHLCGSCPLPGWLQGMDQQYERRVHDQLVEVTCKAESGQYFLITPKLLPGLQYHRSMKILCVNNGEWLPESRGLGGLGSMRKMIERFVERRSAGPSAN